MAKPRPLKAPFPWHGGKRKVASLIWERLGDVENFVEPFAGSLAVLLLRPTEPRVETVNDLDCYVANFWRATQHDPEAVAAHADNPVNELDLHARHRWLVLGADAAEFRKRMRADPDYFDAKVAGWWVWGLCCWIGAGWCDATRIERDAGATPAIMGSDGKGQGVTRRLREKMPTAEQCRTGGKGVHGVGDDPKSKVRIAAHNKGSVGKGVHAGGEPHLIRQKIPNIGGEHPGRYSGAAGVNGRPQLADAYDIGRGVNANGTLGTCAARRAWLVDWFGRLRDRLRLVRVCCGDWLRVCDSESVTTRLGLTGVFFDPPYGAGAGRAEGLYSCDSLAVAADVRRYCLGRGGNRLMRICLAGYAGEGHEELEEHGWSVVEWASAGGYGNRSEKGRANRKKERLWFSPHCQPAEQPGLFDDIGG